MHSTLLVIFDDEGFSIQPTAVDGEQLSALVEYLDENRETVIAAGTKTRWSR